MNSHLSEARRDGYRLMGDHPHFRSPTISLHRKSNGSAIDRANPDLFRHTVGTVLAEMGEHQLTIRDYLRHSNLHVTNKYLQATSKTKRLAQDKLVDAILPTGILPKTNLIQ